VTFDVPGSTRTVASSINEQGQITGNFSEATRTRGFVRDPNGSITVFDASGETDTVPYSINPQGEITGFFQNNTGAHDFVRDPNGNITVFDPPGSMGTSPNSINPQGDITGYFYDRTGGHGFVREPKGTFTVFDPPGAVSTSTAPFSINPKGEITGFFYDRAGLGHSFVRDPNGSITVFDAPGALFQTVAHSINPQGEITGYFTNATNGHGFVRDPNGNITVFDVPGATGTGAVSINPQGQITGSFSDGTGVHGFLRNPPPNSVTGGSPVASNLAQGKAATQSSTLPGYAAAGANSAVDGNTDGAFFDGSVTATNLDSNAWWQVDLGSSMAIGSIVIWNRTDCCGTRLNDYWVFVSDTPFSATDTPATLQNMAGTFSSHQTNAPNPSATIAASTQGRYVRVQLTGANYLSLGEVQVFGPTNPSSSNLAQGKAATQSSTLPGYAMWKPPAR
jgi:hypothetical protein